MPVAEEENENKHGAAAGARSRSAREAIGSDPVLLPRVGLWRLRPISA